MIAPDCRTLKWPRLSQPCLLALPRADQTRERETKTPKPAFLACANSMKPTFTAILALALIASTGCQTTLTKPPETVWEYKTVILDTESVNGTHISETLNKLALQGWEVQSVFLTPSGTPEFLLKRPKQ